MYMYIAPDSGGVPVTKGVHTCIMEYGSTPYVGMAQEKNGCPIKRVQNDMFITLL